MATTALFCFAQLFQKPNCRQGFRNRSINRKQIIDTEKFGGLKSKFTACYI